MEDQKVDNVIPLHTHVYWRYKGRPCSWVSARVESLNHPELVAMRRHDTWEVVAINEIEWKPDYATNAACTDKNGNIQYRVWD